MINYSLKEFVEGLRDQLKEDLPGKLSHDKMSAKAVSGKGIKFKPKGRVKAGAVLILLFEEGDEVFFVLTQRPNYKGTHGGQVSFPGGKREEWDVDLIETALRETEEEIGISKSSVKVIGNLSEYFVGASNHLVLPVVGYIEHSPSFLPDTHEVAEVLKVPIAHLLSPNRVKTTVLEVGEAKFKLQAPYFDLSDKIVWGATAGMLSELKDILLNENRRKA